MSASCASRLEEAAQGDDPYFFGAVIVRDGEVLARGRNLWNQQQDPTAHGEIAAIRRFLAEHGMEKLKGTTLYTSGEVLPDVHGRDHLVRHRAPGLRRVDRAVGDKMGQVMITDAEIIAKAPFLDIVLTGGVLAEESMKLFK